MVQMLLFISKRKDTTSLLLVEEFLMEYPIQTIPDAHVLREDWPDIHRQFGVKGPPALFIYNENGDLIKRHMGAISIKTIVQELQ